VIDYSLEIRFTEDGPWLNYINRTPDKDKIEMIAHILKGNPRVVDVRITQWAVTHVSEYFLAG